jgi:hypothetical protein
MMYLRVNSSVALHGTGLSVEKYVEQIAISAFQAEGQGKSTF